MIKRTGKTAPVSQQSCFKTFQIMCPATAILVTSITIAQAQIIEVEGNVSPVFSGETDWNTALNSLNIGWGGVESYVNVLDGATIITDTTMLFAAGTLTVSGMNSTLTVQNGLFVDEGVLNILNGGRAISEGGGIGYGTGNHGTVNISGDGSVWTSAVYIKLADEGGSGEINLTNGGKIASDLIHIGPGYDNFAVGSLNIGGPSTASAPGYLSGLTVSRPTITFQNNLAEINFNHTDSDYIFDVSLTSGVTGYGSINQKSGVTVLYGDNSSFTGTTTITGGTLLLNSASGGGKLGGSINVSANGTLGGLGTAGSGSTSTVTIAAGGTLSPGMTLGTFTINGELIFEPGSYFAVDVNPSGTNSDLVSVTGDVILNGGSVAHIGSNGNYDLHSTYTILSTNGVMSGEFSTVTSDFAFLTPNLIHDYDTGRIDLELTRNQTYFASVGNTRNQRATGEAIDSIGFSSGHAVYNAIAQLPNDTELIRGSFDQLSGEIHGSAKTVLIEDSRFIRKAANDRIREAFRYGHTIITQPALAYSSTDNLIAFPAGHKGPALWTYGYGSWGTNESDQNAAYVDKGTGGILAGLDMMAGSWQIGILGGYSHTKFEIDERYSSGKSDNYHISLYGGTVWDNIALRGGLAYSWHNIETDRYVSIPGFSNSLKGKYHAQTFQVFSEIGHDINLANSTYLEPFLGLAHVNHHTNRFIEKGGDAKLTGSSGSSGTTFTTLGMRAEQDILIGNMNASLTAMVGWQHSFGDTTPASTHAFSAGNPFTIAGVPISRNVAIIEAGFMLNVTDYTKLELAYQGQISRDASNHGFRASLNVNF